MYHNGFLLVPNLAKRSLGSVLLLKALTALRVGRVLGTTLVGHEVLEESTGRLVI